MKIGNVRKLGHGLQNKHTMSSLAQLQALQAWAINMNIVISSLANTHLIPQLFIQWQGRIAALHQAHLLHYIKEESEIQMCS